MKKFKLFTVLALTAILGFTSCESENSPQPESQRTRTLGNDSTSPIWSDYKRVAMYDGSNDNFLDGNSCTELLFPLTAIVNGQRITLFTRSDLPAAISSIGAFNSNKDAVTFQFPIRVKTSSHTEVVLESQSALDELKKECERAEDEGNGAISCIEINFPIGILVFHTDATIAIEVVEVKSQEQFYTFLTNLQPGEEFYLPGSIFLTASNGTSIKIESDAAFQSAILDCLQREEEVAEYAVEVAAMLSGAIFKVATFITGGVETANNYADYTIEFTNDLKIVAKNQANTTLEEIEGTYAVSSESEVFVDIHFASNTAVSALGNNFIVRVYSDTVITLTSKTDASVTLVFKKI